MKLKKLLACLASACMIATVVPFTVMAAENTTVFEVSTGDQFKAAVKEINESTTKDEVYTINIKDSFELDGKDTYEGNAAIALKANVVDVTINGNGNKITVTEGTRGIRVYGGEDYERTVTFDNITIENKASGGRCIETREGKLELNIIGSSLTTKEGYYCQPLTLGGNREGYDDLVVNIENSNIQVATHGYAVISFNPVELNITGSSLIAETNDGYFSAAIYMKGADSSVGSVGSVINVDGDTILSSKNNASKASGIFGTVVFEDKNIKFNLKDNAQVIANCGLEACHFPFFMSSYNESEVTGCEFNVENINNVVINDTRNEDIIASEPTSKFVAMAKGNKVIIGGQEYFVKLVKELEKGDNGYTEAEASIDGEGYHTLQAAINDASEGDTVKVLKDINLVKSIVVKREVVLDLNGYDIMLEVEDDTDNGYFMIINRGNLTITDESGSEDYGSIIFEYSGESTGFDYATDTILSEAGSTLILEKCNIINNTTVAETGKGNGIADAVLVLGETEETTEFVVEKGANIYGTVTIKDNGAEELNVEINGGFFEPTIYNTAPEYLNLNPCIDITADENTDVVINNGSFAGVVAAVEIDKFILGGKFMHSEPEEEFLAEGRYTKQNEDSSYSVVFDAVAEINGEGYATLREAVRAAEEGDVVTLLKDIELNKTLTVKEDQEITIDLNGCDISFETDDDERYCLIYNKGTLTIDDSSAAGDGTISYHYTGSNSGDAYNTIESAPGSVLNIEGGKIENLSTCLIAYAVDGLTNGGIGNVTVNINGGELRSQKIAVRIFANSTTKTGTLNISGGTIYGRVIIQDASEKANKATLNITDGIFNTNGYKSDVLDLYYAGGETTYLTAAVSGGTFNGEVINSWGKPFVSGGTFKFSPTEEILNGYEIVEDGEAYTVKIIELEIKDAIEVAVPEVEVPSEVSDAGVTEDKVSDTIHTEEIEDLLTEGAEEVKGDLDVNDEVVAELAKEGVTIEEVTEVKVVVEPYLEVAYTNIDVSAENPTVEVEISAYYNVIATAKQENASDKTVTIKSGVEMEVNKPISITIPVPTIFAEGQTVYIDHTHNRKHYTYTATVSSNHTITFIARGLSPFVVSADIEMAEIRLENGEELYVAFTVPVNSIYDADNLPELDGGEERIFLGWSFEGDTLEGEFKVEEDMTLKAEWEAVAPPEPAPVVTYTVTLKDGDSIIDIITVESGSYFNLDTIEIPTKDGYTFIGWAINDSNLPWGEGMFEVSDNIVLKALWEENASEGEDPGEPDPRPSRDDEPLHKAEVSKDLGNGKVILNTKYAEAGERVTLTVKAEEGYELDKLFITDNNGNEIEYKDNGDGTYTFKMPAGNINVDALFKSIEEKAEEPAVVLTIGSLEAEVFGKEVTNDVAPVIVNDRTMLPIRVIAEALGADVKWDGEIRKVTITKGNTVIEIFIDSAVAFVNGTPVDLDAAAFIRNDRTFLPVRFVSESLNAEVKWDGDTREVSIYPAK